MDEKARRERVKKVVREQDQIQSEMTRLRERSSALDAELDQLLKPAGAAQAKGQPTVAKRAPSTPPSRAASEAAPTTKGKGRKRRRRRKQARKGVGAAVAATKAGAKADGKKPPKVTGKGRAKRGQKKATAKTEPSIKEKFLAALRENTDGVDVGVLVKKVYGGDAPETREKCEAYLYKLARQKLVRHDGPKWQLVAATPAP